MCSWNGSTNSTGSRTPPHRSPATTTSYRHYKPKKTYSNNKMQLKSQRTKLAKAYKKYYTGCIIESLHIYIYSRLLNCLIY